eukprot:TRINITY_DN8353_c0_g1_i2.p2 TRINITY_DN8353_c0_g1~~TRINITY_DN8353_c0_g1_i2.p2  ORF type:complete len:169 (-),score=29.73 TRINITY_DN8353_c0_g1_i2:116-622(-)
MNPFQLNQFKLNLMKKTKELISSLIPVEPIPVESIPVEPIPVAILFTQLATYFILLNVELPTEDQLNDYRTRLENLYQKMVKQQKLKEIPLLSFIDVPCWFDYMEADPFEQDGLAYHRVKLQKKLLFESNKDDLALFDYKILLENLKPIQYEAETMPKTYYELLFAEN